MTTPPIHRVSDWELRRMFNEAQLFERAEAGELMTRLIWERRAHPPDEPAGTVSQIIIYAEFDGSNVATVHQYLRKDGDIGASGRPDPKELFLDGKLFKLAKKKVIEDPPS